MVLEQQAMSSDKGITFARRKSVGLVIDPVIFVAEDLMQKKRGLFLLGVSLFGGEIEIFVR
jgi:hypothetical protein